MSPRSTTCRTHTTSRDCADAKPKRKDLKLRKRRKAKATALKLQAQLQADLREAEAGADPQQRRAAISATLEALLEITARVLKHAAANAALKGGKAGGLSLMRSPGASALACVKNGSVGLEGRHLLQRECSCCICSASVCVCGAF